jgi:surfeit locus 1 family protein
MRLTRGGLAGTILMLLVAGVCIRLGFWQLDRLEQRRALNSAVAAGMALPPLELDSASIAALLRNPEAFLHRAAIARGSYDWEKELLLRGRAHEGQPGVHVATLLVLDEADASLIVNRGWMPSPDAATADPRPTRQTGDVEVRGRIQLMPAEGEESTPSEVSVGDTTISTFRRLDHARIASRAPKPLLPIYLELVDSSATGGLVPVPGPVLDEGSHLGYAIQWFSFAAIAVFGFLIVLIRRRRSPGVFLDV